MEFYLAPLEGITGYIYRNALHDFFGTGINKYFMPFLAPHTKRSFNAKEKNDLLPEHNEGMYAVPQILTNSAQDFLRIEKDLLAFGYQELNINLGCPSGTVVAKGRGAGFLAEPEKLDQFLEEIFSKTNAKVSLKTRIGVDEPEEFYRLLEIYNKYPLEELIVHPRVRQELYRGKPHLEIFRYAMEHSKNPLCYNGDIVSVDSYVNLLADWEKGSEEGRKRVTSVMLGRGVLRDPALIEKLSAFASGEVRMADAENVNDTTDRKKLSAFHDRLAADYQSEFSGDQNVLFKMKELWSYMIGQFPGKEKEAKAIRKARRLEEYQAAVKGIFYNVY